MTIQITSAAIRKLGNEAIKCMTACNGSAPPAEEAGSRPLQDVLADFDAAMGSAHLGGLLYVLDTLGVPYTVYWNGEHDAYTGITIAEKTFYVGGGTEGSS